MRNKSALIAGVLAGIASPGTVFADTSYPRITGTDMSRMRNDVLRVGRDFNTVIGREYGKQKTRQAK